MLSVAGLATLTLILGAVSILGIRKLNSAVDTAYDRDAKKIELSGKIAVATSDMIAMEQAVVLRVLTNEPALVAENRAVFDAAKDRLEKAVAALEPLLVTAEGRGALKTIATSAAEWALNHEQLLRHAGNGKAQQALRVHDERIRAIAKHMNDEAGQLAATMWAVAQRTKEDSQTVKDRAQWIVVGSLLAAIVAGIAAFVTTLGISRTLRKLTVDLGTAADQLSGAAAQVASCSQSLAQGASEQAASLEETSASGQEISAMARSNSERSRAAADIVRRSKAKSAQTGEALDQTVTAIGEIDTQSSRIAGIIKVIDEIAFQTNILALNAAVEAARAGEAGMGFAVVAEEVRSLALRSAAAAKDTASLIDACISASRDGKGQIAEVAVAFRNMLDDSSKLAELVEEVNEGSSQQTDGLDQIAKAIVEMERVTQSNASTAEENASAAEELTGQSETLKAIVNRLTVMVEGSAAVVA